MKTFLFILAACQCTQQPEPGWLQSLLESGSMPVLTALLLGLLTALSPCPLATNIAAIGYLGRRIDNRRTIFLNGLYYTLGRTLAFTLLAWVLLWLIRTGATALGFEDALRVWGERLLGPVLVVMGVLMFFADRLRLPSLNTSGGEKLADKGAWGALLLGVFSPWHSARVVPCFISACSFRSQHPAPEVGCFLSCSVSLPHCRYLSWHGCWHSVCKK